MYGSETIISDVTDRDRAEEAFRQSETRFRVLIENASDAITLLGRDGRLKYVSASAVRLMGYTAEEIMGVAPAELTHPDDLPTVMRRLAEALRRPAKIASVQYRFRHKDGTWLWLESTISNLLGEPSVAAIVFNFRDISERKQAEAEIHGRLAELEAVNQVSTASRSAQTLEEMLPVLLDVTLKLMDASAGSISLYDPLKDELRTAIKRGWLVPSGPIPPQKPGTGVTGHVLVSGQPYLSRSFRDDPLLEELNRARFPPGGGVCLPIRAGDTVIGTIVVIVPVPREVTASELRLLTILSEIAGNAIQRTTLHQQTERRMQQLSALSVIDRAISSSFDLSISLTTLLNQVITQLGADAADVLLYEAGSQTLKFIAGQGFRIAASKQIRLRLGEGYAGRAILERRLVQVPDLASAPESPLLARTLASEGFVSYLGVPLIAKGQIMGVLEIFQRSALQPDGDWLEFLETLAGQAAIAIDNAMLFDSLQRSNTDLALAYDATIEGWSRVTDLTIQLARAFGLSGEELAHARWGSLLHDIGKMGVPDQILLKPGPLTEEEWVVMKRHPRLAYEMLAPIQYLRAALDIPYRHHEKWDGSGYPLGLKGEQIPLTARIFAVVDVWDALSSDRPYRLAWPEEKVRAHVLALAGTHFDPEVVRVSMESGVLGRKGGD